MTGPNMGEDKYRGMPRWAKILYWILVIVFAGVIGAVWVKISY